MLIEMEKITLKNKSDSETFWLSKYERERISDETFLSKLYIKFLENWRKITVIKYKIFLKICNWCNWEIEQMKLLKSKLKSSFILTYWRNCESSSWMQKINWAESCLEDCVTPAGQRYCDSFSVVITMVWSIC